MPLPLPTSVDAVDAAWLSAALSTRYPGVEISACQLDDVLWGTGTKIRVSVQYNDAGRAAGLPSKLVVKGGFAEHRERMSFLYDFETRFYQEFAPQLDIHVPACFFAGHDPQRHQHLVILENLTPDRATFCRVQDPLSYAQTAAFLDRQARYHARWWGGAEFRPGGRLSWLKRTAPLSAGDEGAYARGQLEPEVWKHYMCLPRSVAVPKLFHDREWMRAALMQLNEFNRTGPDCFTHNDAHLGNMYLRADGEPGFVDWQCYRSGPWHHDVTYFMVSALDAGDRRRWERDLLNYYLQRLSIYGVVEPPSFDVAWDAYRRQIVYGLYFWMVNPVEWQVEVNNCAVAPRFAIAALDLDTYSLMA